MKRQPGIRALGLSILAACLSGCVMPWAAESDFSGGAEGALRIVQVSDLHVTAEKSLYAQTMRRINAASPDLVVFTGDQIESPEGLPLLEDYLASIEIECPKYAIMGNWEYWGNLDVEEYREALAARGVRLLVNQQERIDIRGRPVSIYGLDDYLEGSPTFQAYEVHPEDLNIVLGHCPILFDRLKSEFAAYANNFHMFSGHTHGGQVTFFGIPLYLPEGSGAYCAGAYREGNFSLFVSKGVGNSTVDFRLFADPQIEIIEL
jgi:predicted MPP superfamily phosphohydrolase